MNSVFSLFSDCHSLKDEEDMREELNIMCKIRPHANIINLLGYCTTSGE